jgi:nitrite reductase (NO-forming)
MSQRAAMLTMMLLMAAALLAENSPRSFAPPGLEAIHGEEQARLSAAPHVPPAITRRHATKVRLNIEVREHTKQLADGVTYQGVMPKLPLTERDIAAVLSYVRNHFGNRGTHIRLADVARVRVALARPATSSGRLTNEQ